MPGFAQAADDASHGPTRNDLLDSTPFIHIPGPNPILEPGPPGSWDDRILETSDAFKDFGTYSDESCDYPDFIRPAAEAVAAGRYERGIVLGGSGNGEAMVANKISGIRCAVCWDVRSAKLSREHNNANILSIGEWMMSIHEVLEIVDLWLKTPFAGGRHQDRLEKIERR